jgi:predicted dehydrogenase
MKSENLSSEKSLASATKKIRVGIIGAGNFAGFGHIPALNQLPDYEVVAVQARRLEAAEKLAKQAGIKYVVNTPEELASHPEVDLVVIVTTAPQHDESIRAAIAAKKDVYAEWPFTTSTKNAEELTALAKAAGIRTIIGLQRRLAPTFRYVGDLIRDGYIGKLRSIRLHVSMNSFQATRPLSLKWSVGKENFNDVVVIFGAHFLDPIFANIGWPESFYSELVNQFPEVTIAETGEVIPTTAPDVLALSGRLKDNAVLSVHIEGGKRSNSGLQIDITGDQGDLKITNESLFGNSDQHYILEGAQGDDQLLKVLPVPEAYKWVSSPELGTGVVELAHQYAAFADDIKNGTTVHTTFEDGLKMHQFFDLMNESSEKGISVNL